MVKYSGMEQEEFQDPFHLGNTVSIESGFYGRRITGKIIYRDNERIRILPSESTDRAVEFQFNETYDAFKDEYDVTYVEVIYEETADRFVQILGATPGETLEFFDLDGKKVDTDGIVKSVNEKNDKILLEDGRVLKFKGIGPQPPIAVIRVLSTKDGEIPAEDRVELPNTDADNEMQQRYQDQMRMIELLKTIIPTTSVVVIDQNEIAYPESMQRDDLLQDFIEQRKNPKMIRYIEREVDVFMALKNLTAKKNESGEIVGMQPFYITTFGDALSVNSKIPVAIPIVSCSKVLYLDIIGDEEQPYNKDHVTPRYLTEVEMNLNADNENYDTGATSNAIGFAFSAFMQKLLGFQTLNYHEDLLEDQLAVVSSDQDVYRTAPPNIDVQALSSELPAGASIKPDKPVPPVSLAYLVNDTKGRSTRVLKSDYINYAKTGDSIKLAPSDPGTVKAFLMLPAKAALALRPPTRGDLMTLIESAFALENDDLPSVDATITGLFNFEPGSPLHIWTLSKGDTATTELAPWLANVIKYVLVKSESLGHRTPHILQLLDTIGLISSELDIAGPIKMVIDKWVADAQAEWDSLFAVIKNKAIQPSSYQFPKSDAPLWALLRSSESFKSIQEVIHRQYPAIADSPLLQVAILASVYQGDYTPLVAAAIQSLTSKTQDPLISQSNLIHAVELSKRFQLNNSIIQNMLLSSLIAEPQINPCEHVVILEAIRNVRDVSDRSKMLVDFIDKYQGKRDGDWITCNLCEQHTVCYHEIMEMEALAQPFRFEEIQKQMFIRFGGERYEGSIVCRNCGQALREIDFDNSVEFDDNGKPVIQNAVVTEEQMDDSDEPSIIAAIRAEMAPETKFTTAEQDYIYQILVLMAERAGIQLTPEVIQRIVRRTEDYRLAVFPSTKEKWDSSIRAQSRGTQKRPYEVVKANIVVPAIAALLLIELQTSSPILQVINPFQICRFSREGFPLDDTISITELEKGQEKGEEIKPTALLYITCCVASIEKNDEPWPLLAWSPDTKNESRRNKVLKAILGALSKILGHEEKYKVAFTSEIQDALYETRNDIEAQRKRSLISNTDQLPAGFRPKQFLMSADDIRQPERPINTNLVQDGRLLQLLKQNVINNIIDLHSQALETISPISISQFADPTFSINGEQGSASQATIQEQMTVINKLRIEDVGSPSAGTHLWPFLESQQQQEVRKGVDPNAIYKLFLRYCFTGPKTGAPHEIDVGYTCRQCGFEPGAPKEAFEFPSEQEFIDYQKTLLDGKVEITPENFNRLSNAVRKYGIIHQRGSTFNADGKWIGTLYTLVDAKITGFSYILKQCLDSIKQINGEINEETVAEVWNPISEYQADLRNKISSKLLTSKVKKDTIFFEVVDKLLEDPWIEGPNAIQEYWCSKVKAAAEHFEVTHVYGPLWTELAKDHRQQIDQLVNNNSRWFNETVTDEMRSVLKEYTISPFLNVWLAEVRKESSDLLWNTEIARMLLKTIVLEGWWSILDEESYNEIPIEIKTNVSSDLTLWTQKLLKHANDQFIKFSKEEVKRILQDRAALERVSIVKEFEDMKDPDRRAAQLMMKRYKIGRWGEGTNLTKYDPDRFDAEAAQRERMGIFTDLSGTQNAKAKKNDFGFNDTGAAAADGYDIADGGAGEAED